MVLGFKCIAFLVIAVFTPFLFFEEAHTIIIASIKWWTGRLLCPGLQNGY